MAKGRGSFGKSHRRGGVSNPFTIERSSKRASDNHGYYFGWNGTAYTCDDYRPEYSDGQVTEADVQGLLQDLNKSNFSDPVLCPCELSFVPIILGCMGISITILSTNMVTTETDFSTNRETQKGTIPVGSAIAGLVLMVLLGIGSVIVICYSANKRAANYLKARGYHISLIIQKHKNSVFEPKNCSLRMSPQGSFVIIEFNWKPRSAMAVVPPDYEMLGMGVVAPDFTNPTANRYQANPMMTPGYGGGPGIYSQPPPSF
jgi:hypothetical protein